MSATELTAPAARLLQLARHSEQYAENTMRLPFETYLDFATMNQHLIQQHGSGHYRLALDASYLPKSGKATQVPVNSGQGRQAKLCGAWK